ncbi:hypothetical protein HN51_042865 [Arachis hypogaea]|uniref:zinc finger protein ZAT12 n=1 Tax=Arachis ipaensis TaxID=130454 RepID=UPI0007AF46C6|nr:zinc finger protein ZAT12 [Arachis ipaensis]XP_025672161.1 zinc finger protein ZAT12 [Arachis hypogaea]QHN96104.1 Zinc finger protein [Arachis hypogaea]
MKRGREQIEVDNCLTLLSKVGESDKISSVKGKELMIDDGAFKCKTCERSFTSFQALGGHRASHKKPKLMVLGLSCHDHHLRGPNTKPRMHPCPICGVEFSIGQALGGHMRKHRVATAKDDEGDGNDHHNKRLNLCLDLNLTPFENDLIKLGLMRRIPLLSFH